ncbi:MAG: FAD-dependent oxidoreductase [Betaproteobacteria bacterium]|nr:MAG: FAD-dependent oxidoreductase [Betaproteobacteria bacterium]
MSLTIQKAVKKLQTDVLVVGGGTAGFVAAIAAARNGARVTLVEQRDHLGGTHSGGMVMMIRSMRHMRAPRSAEHKKVMITQYESSFDDEQLVFSIAQEYLDRMLEIGSAWGSKGQATARQLFDPEIAKWVIEQMVVEAGVDVWFYSQTTDLLLSNGSVNGAIIENLQERIEIAAKVTIDATGDGNVCAAAGAGFEMGDPEAGLCQPMTLYFVMGGVALDRTLAYIKGHPDEFNHEYAETILRLRQEGKPITVLPFKARIREAVERDEYPIPYGLEKVNPETLTYMARPMFRNGSFRYDLISHNMDMAYNVDATDRHALTRATIGMRDVAVRMAAFYRKYVPGYEDAYLVHTAQSVGVRDSRRIVGDYTLTKDDVLSGRHFEDGIGRYGSVVDVHDKDGKQSLLLAEVGGSGWFHIPYRSLLPRGIRNLLVAGRCISADYVAQGCTRSQAACMMTGQATGTAAALAIKAGAEPRAVEIAALQRVLMQQNQII